MRIAIHPQLQRPKRRHFRWAWIRSFEFERAAKAAQFGSRLPSVAGFSLSAGGIHATPKRLNRAKTKMPDVARAAGGRPSKTVPKAGKVSKPERFTKAHAKRTGRSEAAVQQDVAEATALGDDVMKKIFGTSLDKPSEITALAATDERERHGTVLGSNGTALGLNGTCLLSQQRLVVPIGESNQADRNGILAAVTGFPAITVPAGFSQPTATAPLGVPIGLDLLGRPWSEWRLIQIAHGFEQATHVRKPPDSAPPLTTK
jgi:hypothetical protein